MLPEDPVILLSFVNMKLRDYYKDLRTLCEDLNVEEQEIVNKLNCIDYHYDSSHNQFV